MTFLFAIVISEVVWSEPVYIPDKASNSEVLNRILNHNKSIDDLSSNFIGTPYKAGTLIGSASEPEKLTVNVTALDCFTFIDYIEALKGTNSASSFINRLARIRYIDGSVSFTHRRHFFAQWADGLNPTARDVTKEVSGSSKSVIKYLNLDVSGRLIIPGIPILKKQCTTFPREISLPK